MLVERLLNRNQSLFYNLTKTEKAYLAGIIDADGTIGLYKIKNRKRPQISPRIHIYNTNLNFMKWLKKLLNVNFHKIQDKGISIASKPCYRLNIYQREKILGLLEVIKPFLIIKREQATIVLDFVKQRKQALDEALKNGTKLNIPYDVEAWRLIERMKKLNKRGK